MIKRKQYTRLWTLGGFAGVASLLLAPMQQAQAGTTKYATYAVLKGVRGDAKFAPGSFVISNLSYGAQLAAAVRPMDTTGMSVGKAVLNRISFVKPIGITSPEIEILMMTGRTVSGSFYFQETSNGKTTVLLQLDFRGVIVSDEQAISGGPEIGVESVEIQPISETLTVRPRGQNGVPTTPSTVTYDLSTQKTS